MAAQPAGGESAIETPVIIEEKVIKADGEVAMRSYQRGKLLGKGGFARCFEFTSLETGKHFAAKVVPKMTLKKARSKQKLMSEIKIHRTAKHPNIVNFEHFFEDSDNVYILLELCPNHTLSEVLRRRKRLTELEVQCYLLQIVDALKYLHGNKIIHRDLKLGNLFLSERVEIKLGDFGLATTVLFEGEKKRTICGTPNYIAPEILDSNQGHSYEVDIWSLGVVLYTLLVGKPPFETSEVKATYRKIRLNAYTFPDHVPLSEPSKGLISRILISDPSKRPTLDEILANDFLNQGNSIPKFLPSSFLACPPSTAYLRQFEPNAPPARTQRKDVSGSLRALREKRFSHTERLEKPANALTDHTEVSGPEVWIRKWVDYSSRYGLGYELNTGAVGVFFNDASKLVLSLEGHQFAYIEKLDRREEVLTYALTDYPKALQKKVTLLQHFRSYLDSEAGERTTCEEESEPKAVYVKKWMRTKHAALFRLSCKVVQVDFQDKTQIVLASAAKVVSYVDKTGTKTNYVLNSTLETANIALAKRLKYAKDLLVHMMKAAARAAESRDQKS